MGRIQKWCTKTHQWLIKKTPYHLHIGQQAERLAEKYLIKKGWYVVARNFATSVGEIDRIMCDQNTLVFVEVRLRIDKCAQESVTWAKQRKLIKTAHVFLKKHPSFCEWPMRFDVIAMSQCSLDAITWLPNAFEAT